MLVTVRSATAMTSRRFSQSKRLRQTRRIGTCREWHGRCGDETGALWDPIPITMPTYVEAAGASTVRTIDLSGPGATSSSAGHEGPVTAMRRTRHPTHLQPTQAANLAGSRPPGRW